MTTLTVKTLKLLALSLTAALSLAACNGGTAPAATVPATPQAFFSANGAGVQVQSITLGTSPVSVTFAKGTALTFAPGSLLDAGGAPYSGPVQVSVREVVSKSDMILSNVLAVSGVAPLVSGGMFNLDVKTPAGAALNVNPAQGVAVAVPLRAEANPKMQLFVPARCDAATGAVNCPVPVTPAAGDSSVNWAPVAGQFGVNTSTNPGAYVFSVFNKGWINCDFFYSDPRPKTTIHIGFTPVNDANTIMFLVPQGINTVIALYTQDGANARKSYQNSLPIGMTTELVAITFDGGKQYLAHKTVTVSADLTDSLNFAEASAADIKTYLAALN